MAINAISANMDSFSSSRTAALKKQPSHMEAAHFGDLGKASFVLQDCQQFLFFFLLHVTGVLLISWFSVKQSR